MPGRNRSHSCNDKGSEVLDYYIDKGSNGTPDWIPYLDLAPFGKV